jgi:hypothetical protein
MSRTSTSAPPRRQFTEEDEARRATYSDKPSVRGWDGATDYIRGEFGVTISVNYVKKLVSQRRLPRYVIGGIVHFTPVDLFTVIILCNRRVGSVRKTHRDGPTTAA